MRKYLAIKMGADTVGWGDVRSHLEMQIKRYPAAAEGETRDYTEACMRRIVEGEKKAIEMCLEYVKGVEGEKEEL